MVKAEDSEKGRVFRSRPLERYARGSAALSPGPDPQARHALYPYISRICSVSATDPKTRTAMLLGRYGPLEDAVPAILIVERLHFDLQTANEIPSQLSDYAVLLENDSYCTATAHLPGPSVKFTLIAPATDVVS
jgi:hypothetical protein